MNTEDKVQDSGLPLPWVASKLCGVCPMPRSAMICSGMGAASVHVAGLLIDMDCRGWVVAWGVCGSLGEPSSTRFQRTSNCLVGAMWPDWRYSRVSGGSCALCYSCRDYSVPSTCWELSGDSWWTHVVTWVFWGHRLPTLTGMMEWCSHSNTVGDLCVVLQGDVYGYKHALAISQYDMEDAPMRDRERVSRNISYELCTIMLHIISLLCWVRVFYLF